MAAEAVGAAAAQRGVAPVVSAVDAGGELVFLVRPDAAQVASVQVTTDKARTAAIYRRPSKDFEDQASGGRPSALHLARAVPLQGGMPIEYAGEVIGAVGVSGARSADEDQELATIGVQAFAAALDEAATAAPRWGPSHGEHRHPDRRRLGSAPARARPSCCPAAPTRSSTCRPTRAPRSSAPSWRYADARVQEIDFVEVGGPTPPTRSGPATSPTAPTTSCPTRRASTTTTRAGERSRPPTRSAGSRTGRVCFNWYRTAVTIPERVGELDPTGATVVFEVVIDDYAEVWVDGALPVALGDTGGQVVGGFNAPNRVVLTRDARPGDSFQIAVFGINGPISASPHNYIWMRTATLDFYAARARAAWRGPRPSSSSASRPASTTVAGDGARVEQVAGGFEFTEGPVWSPEGALLFTSPNTNAIYRWDPRGEVTVFRSKSGYTGHRHRALSPARLQRPDLRPRRAPDRCASTATAASSASSRTATSPCSPTATRAGG